MHFKPFRSTITMSARSQTCAIVISSNRPVYFTIPPAASAMIDWANPNGNVITPTIHTPNTQPANDYIGRNESNQPPKGYVF